TTKISTTRPQCDVTVGETPVDGFVDTGSQITSLPDTVIETDAPLRSFTMADGKSLLWTKGPVEVELTVAGVTVEHPVYLKRGEEAIIGSDLLDKFGGLIDYADNRSLKFTKPPKIVPKDAESEPEGERIEASQTEEVVHREYADLMQGLGKTELTEHEIDTGDHKPIAIRGRRIPAHYLDAVAEHVKSLLDEDIIEESHSDWLFPLVIIKKKNGEIRMANDLRK